MNYFDSSSVFSNFYFILSLYFLNTTFPGEGVISTFLKSIFLSSPAFIISLIIVLYSI